MGLPIFVRSSPSLGLLAKAQQCRSLPSWCTWPGVGWGGVPGLPLSHRWFQVAWVKWMDSSAPFTMMPETNYCNIIVPTMDTVQMSYLLGMLLTNHKPVSVPLCPASSYPKAQVRVAGPCSALSPVKTPTLPGAVHRANRHGQDPHHL